MMYFMKNSRTSGKSIAANLLTNNKDLLIGMLAGIGYEISVMGGVFLAFLLAADLIFVLAITERVKLFESKPLVWLGNLSLYIYLVHQYIGYTIEYYLTEYFGRYIIAVPIIAVAAVIMLAIAIRWISQNIIHIIKVAFGEQKQ